MSPRRPPRYFSSERPGRWASCTPLHPHRATSRLSRIPTDPAVANTQLFTAPSCVPSLSLLRSILHHHLLNMMIIIIDLRSSRLFSDSQKRDSTPPAWHLLCHHPNQINNCIKGLVALFSCNDLTLGFASVSSRSCCVVIRIRVFLSRILTEDDC